MNSIQNPKLTPSKDKRLSPEKFTFSNYIGNVGFGVHQCVLDAYTTPLKLQPGVTFIGYCDAKRLSVRPKSEGFAIMVEMDGEDLWFHDLNLPI